MATKKKNADLSYLVHRLRNTSSDLVNLGELMKSFGAKSEIAKHGVEMVGAGNIAAEWADSIEEIHIKK